MRSLDLWAARVICGSVGAETRPLALVGDNRKSGRRRSVSGHHGTVVMAMIVVILGQGQEAMVVVNTVFIVVDVVVVVINEATDGHPRERRAGPCPLCVTVV